MLLQCRKNLTSFLTEFPALIETHTWARGPFSILGKYPRNPWDYQIGKWGKDTEPEFWGVSCFPGQDHAFYWRVKGLRGPVVCTMFPCRGTIQNEEDQTIEDCCKDMFWFAEKFGFAVEIEPSDVRDFYYPGSTIPIVWSKAGRDWRQIAGAKT